MSDNPFIQEAVRLAKAGDKVEARRLIDEVLRNDPDHAAAWLIMAQLVEDKRQAIRCMRQVIRLRPNDEKAKAILARLERAAHSDAGMAAPFVAPKETRSTLVGALQSPTGQIVASVIGVLFALCIFFIIATQVIGRRGGAAGAAQDAADASDQLTLAVTGTPTLMPSPTAPPPTATPDPEAEALVQALNGLTVKPYDPADWLVRTGVVEGPLEQPGSKSYRVGSRETFYLIVGDYLVEVPFVLRYQNDVVDMWVQDGISVDSGDLKSAADRFAAEIYPTNHDVFGEELSPGIDGSRRLSIMNALFLGVNVGGYFASADEYPQVVYPYSNQREAFYMSLLAGDVGSDEYMSILAHEFQHMIRWHEDPNEDNWMDEGLSQLAERINGFNTAYTHYNYLFDSRVSLNGWSQDFRTSYSNYGASYLFDLYLWERMGTDVVREVAHNPEGGLKAIDAALVPRGLTVDDLFADWIVANYVNDPAVGDGRYGYQKEQLIPICPRVRLAESQTQRPDNAIPQYSPNYVELEGEGEFTLSFKGDTEVSLIRGNPYSGRYFWWSNRVNRSQTSLARDFDLSGLSKAALDFWTWYDIQEGRDEGYVLISTDGGETWEFLTGTSMRYHEDEGDYGPNYTGASGGGSTPLWVNERIDLTPYTGQKVRIKFEYVTDTYYEGLGWAIDNIRIPEIDYLYDMEQPQDGWIEDGFIRASNLLPQKWTVSLVTYDGGTQVQHLPIAADGTASATVTLTPEVRRATIIVGAMAPVTGMDAHYQLTVGGTGVMDRLQNSPGVLLQDNFESPCGTLISFVLPDYSFRYKDGRYEIWINAEDQIIWAPTFQEFTNTVIDVDSVQERFQPDSMTGIICRFQDDGNFYSFDISNDGTFAIIKVDDYQVTMLQDWTESDVINTGDGAQNHLKVTCDGRNLMFAVNGTVLAHVEDASIHRGDLGFHAVTGEGKDILVAFDNLIVTTP